MGPEISYLWLPSDGRVLPLRSSSLWWSLLSSELMSSRDLDMEGSPYVPVYNASAMLYFD